MEHISNIEYHPWEAFIPDGAKVLVMGTFPPQPPRWAMDFYYPNRTNHFWKVCGIVFPGDPMAFYDTASKTYRLEAIKSMLRSHKIALCDTAHAVRRLKGNASDKFLDIIEPVDLDSLLARMPECVALATTGQKAAETLAALTHTHVPAMGASVCYERPDGRRIDIWRLPSTSRAYPLAPDKKAEFYRTFFKDVGIID